MVGTLVDYIADLLRRGYTVDTVRSYLLKTGYDATQVDQAISTAYQYVQTGQQPAQPQEIKHVIAFSKTSLLVVGVVFLIVFSFFGYSFLFPGVPGELLDLSIDPIDTLVVPGSPVTFVINLENLGGKKRYDISLTYEIRAVQTDQLLTLAGETVALETKQSTRAEVIVPSDASPGDYMLYATASYQGQKAKANFQFSVEVPFVSEQPVLIEQPTPVEEEPSVFVPAEDLPFVLTFPEGYTGQDYDQDGIPDSQDPDHDNDGVPNEQDPLPFDTDDDQIPNLDDIDDDNDGIPDDEDEYPLDDTNTGRPRQVTQMPGQIPGVLPAEDVMCPGDCNDFDVCTIDQCTDGACKYTSIQPCCGNFVCEAGETPGFCPDDCAPPEPLGPGKEEQIQDAISALPSKEKVAAICNTLPSRSASDECFDKVAKEAKDSSFCDLIKDSAVKDACYLGFAIEHSDFSVCPKVSNRLLKNSCFSLANLQKAQESMPQEVEGQ